MNKSTQITLVDSSARRRAAISHCLSGSRIHVEPFEDMSELITHWPKGGVLLVHDDGAVLAELMDYMSRSANWLPVIAFAEDPTTRQIVRAMRQEAVDFVSFPFTCQEISEIVRDAAVDGGTLVGTKLREAMAKSHIERLSRREREVLEGIAGGLSNRMIGERLSISPRTVEIHRANMLNKIGATHTSEAIRMAIEANIVN